MLYADRNQCYILWFCFCFSNFLKINLFIFYIYLWLCWVFVSVRGLSLVAASGGHSSSRYTGLSLSRPLLLRSTGSRCAGSVVVAQGLSCSVACGNLPRPGLEPMSPALAGRFSTTAPPGKPCPFFKRLCGSGKITQGHKEKFISLENFSEG